MTKKLFIVVILLFPATLFADPSIPDGFILQVLEPTGGRIIRPADWYYTESHRGPSYTWILSKEDASKVPYDTGVRIQTLVGVEKGTGKSPKEFVLDFYEHKKNAVQKIYKKCNPQDQGLFTRICLEVDEGDYHILYSLFWGNRIDIVTISIAGTRRENWVNYESTFNQMSSFELIDMNRFEAE